MNNNYKILKVFNHWKKVFPNKENRCRITIRPWNDSQTLPEINVSMLLIQLP